MYPRKVSAAGESFEPLYGQLLNQVPRLQSRTAISELSGGLTNRNLLIETPSGKYVARISSNDSSLLSIDRNGEYENSKRAASAGIGAEVFDYLPGQGLLVIGFLPGRTYGASDVSNNLKRIAESCQALHKSEKFLTDFNMFDVQKKYLHLVQVKGFRMPAGYLELYPYVEKMAAVFALSKDPKVPCNNDLLPANFIDGGDKVWIIDYEYSGNNDACFELGNIWSEAELEIEKLEELVTHYYGRSRPDKFARAWLYSALAKYGWTLWASIQDSVSPLDFDFWEWGMAKHNDAQRMLRSGRFEEMLAQAARNSPA